MDNMAHLPSDKVRPCIDLVDSLRYYIAVEQSVALPAIAVIGDQNSGKSSVLEALSGVQLPRERKYTLVLRMTKAKRNEWRGMVRMKKYSHSSFEEKVIPDRKDVIKMIDQVKHRDIALSSGMLILEITSPDVPDLTLIDLPSIPKADTKTHTVDQIKSHIRTIITNPECIIMVVVPCDVDIASTKALKTAQIVDPDGERTLGILTKPDIISKGKERSNVDIVQNKVIHLRKGFMIVRCGDKKEMSVMDPIDKDVIFFKDHSFFKSLYNDGYATLPKLAARLSLELAQHIEKYLPQLKEYVKKEYQHADAAMRRFGNAPPSEESEKRIFLTDKLTSFCQEFMRMSTGDLPHLVDQRVFEVWRKIVTDSEESLLSKIEAEAALDDQSRFSLFQTLDCLIKEEIKRLEDPALFTLSNSAEIVKKELLKLSERHFEGYSSLISKTQSAIADVISQSQKAAEPLLRTQFKMEQFEAQVEGSKWTNQKTEKKRGITAQLHSYYQTVCRRLTCQTQMMIRFHIIKETCTKLQTNVFVCILESKDNSSLLQYASELRLLRNKTEKHFISLKQAQILLSEL